MKFEVLMAMKVWCDLMGLRAM